MTAHAWQHANAPRRGSAILLALFFLTALFLLAQAFGRGLAVEPYLSTVVLGAMTVAAAGNAVQRARILPGVSDHDVDDGCLRDIFLERAQLPFEIGRLLPRQIGYGVGHAHPVGAVAGGANLRCLGLAFLGIACCLERGTN